MTERVVDPDTRQKAIHLYDRFTHDGMERRAFMTEMARLARSVAAAELLIAGIAASPAAATIVPENDPHIFTRTQTLAGGYKAYVAEPRTRSLKATVLVIHENRGLNDHIRDVARRLAAAGFRARALAGRLPRGRARHALALRRDARQRRCGPRRDRQARPEQIGRGCGGDGR